MGLVLAEWAFATSRRLFQTGILVTGIGAGLLGVAAATALLPPRVYERVPGTLPSATTLAAAILMVAGLVLVILSVHYGVSPWSPRPARPAPPV